MATILEGVQPITIVAVEKSQQCLILLKACQVPRHHRLLHFNWTNQLVIDSLLLYVLKLVHF